MNSRASTAELYQLERTASTTELSQLERPACSTELSPAWKTELEKLRAQTWLQRGKLQPPWWDQAGDSLAPRGSAECPASPLRAFPVLDLDKLELMALPLAQASLAMSFQKRKLAPKLSRFPFLVAGGVFGLRGSGGPVGVFENI